MKRYCSSTPQLVDTFRTTIKMSGKNDTTQPNCVSIDISELVTSSMSDTRV